MHVIVQNAPHARDKHTYRQPPSWRGLLGASKASRRSIKEEAKVLQPACSVGLAFSSLSPSTPCSLCKGELIIGRLCHGHHNIHKRVRILRTSITETMQGLDTQRLTQSVHTVGIWQRPGTQPSLSKSNDFEGNELWNMLEHVSGKTCRLIHNRSREQSRINGSARPGSRRRLNQLSSHHGLRTLARFCTCKHAGANTCSLTQEYHSVRFRIRRKLLPPWSR